MSAATLDIRHACSGLVPQRGMQFARSRSCGRGATIQRDGKWYCGTHDPEAKAARKAKSNAKWEAKFDADRKAMRLQFAAPKLLAACEAALPWLQQRANDEIVKQVEQAIKDAKA